MDVAGSERAQRKEKWNHSPILESPGVSRTPMVHRAFAVSEIGTTPVCAIDTVSSWSSGLH
jgi:hypothetical protein